MTILPAVLALSVALLQTPADTPIVITNVNVLPMGPAVYRDSVLRAQTVVIEHGVITYIGSDGPSAQPPNRPSAHRIDGSGKYLIPGLVDVHVHFHGNFPSEWPTLLKLILANGRTSVV